MSTISSSTTSTTAYKVTADTTGTLVLQTGASPTTAMTIDGSQNVGIGTSSPSQKLDVNGDIQQRNGGGVTIGKVENASGWYSVTGDSANVNGTQMSHGSTLRFLTAGSERMRIDASGNLLVGTTSIGGAGGLSILPNQSAGAAIARFNRSSTTSTSYPLTFQNGGSDVGYVSYTNTTALFVSVSDYRLKENIQTMSGALSVVLQLKPCTYTWKSDGSSGQGFIAHELQSVIPEAVSRQKDAVDENGNPQYQGIDTSFLVATLTAAIQELKAELDAAKADIATLKGAA